MSTLVNSSGILKQLPQDLLGGADQQHVGDLLLRGGRILQQLAEQSDAMHAFVNKADHLLEPVEHAHPLDEVLSPVSLIETSEDPLGDDQPMG